MPARSAQSKTTVKKAAATTASATDKKDGKVVSTRAVKAQAAGAKKSPTATPSAKVSKVAAAKTGTAAAKKVVAAKATVVKKAAAAKAPAVKKAAAAKAPAVKKAASKAAVPSKAAAKKSVARGSAEKATGAESRAATGERDSVKTGRRKVSAKAPTPAPRSAATEDLASSDTPTATAPSAASASRPSAGASGVPRLTIGGRSNHSANTAPLDAKFVDEMRAALENTREQFAHHADAIKAEADSLARDMGAEVQFDDESGEGGTLSMEREQDLMLWAQARASLEEIDEALARVAGGTYGQCLQCGQTITKNRLRALPHAALCIDCKSGALLRR